MQRRASLLLSSRLFYVRHYVRTPARLFTGRSGSHFPPLPVFIRGLSRFLVDARWSPNDLVFFPVEREVRSFHVFRCRSSLDSTIIRNGESCSIFILQAPFSIMMAIVFLWTASKFSFLRYVSIMYPLITAVPLRAAFRLLKNFSSIVHSRRGPLLSCRVWAKVLVSGERTADCHNTHFPLSFPTAPVTPPLLLIRPHTGNRNLEIFQLPPLLLPLEPFLHLCLDTIADAPPANSSVGRC